MVIFSLLAFVIIDPVTAPKTSNTQLVDLVWKIKRRLAELEGETPELGRLLHSAEGRAELVRRARESDDETLKALARGALVMDRGGRITGRQKAVTAATAGKRKTAAPTEPSRRSRKATGLIAALSVGALALGVIGFFAGQRFGTESLESAVPTGPALEQASAVLRLPASDPDIVLRIHGSNTVGAVLAPELVVGYFQGLGATDIRLVASDVDNERVVQALFPEKVLGIEIHAHGSSSGFAGMRTGRADIAQSSRAIKAEEAVELRSQFGDLTGAASEHIIGLDGLAVITHPSNPLYQLTVDQLAQVFAGLVSDWSELGAGSGPIQIYARDERSGTYDTFASLVLDRAGVALAGNARRYESNAELSDDVAADPAGIGFTGLPYVRRAKLLAIADSAGAQALIPTSFTVGTEDYALSRRLYFYVPESGNRSATGLIEFALSEAGQDIVRNAGFVSQNIYAEEVAALAQGPADLRAATAGAKRLSLNFRFREGNVAPDNKAIRDMRRLVTFMEREENRGRELLLLGFTDSAGDPQFNRQLSLDRAQVLEQLLAAGGVNIALVAGFGEVLPVASNSSRYGRNRNRRVEVWIR